MNALFGVVDRAALTWDAASRPGARRPQLQVVMLTFGIKLDPVYTAGQIKTKIMLEYFHLFMFRYFGSLLLKMKIAAQVRDQVVTLHPQSPVAHMGKFMTGLFTQVGCYQDAPYPTRKI